MHLRAFTIGFFLLAFLTACTQAAQTATPVPTAAISEATPAPTPSQEENQPYPMLTEASPSPEPHAATVEPTQNNSSDSLTLAYVDSDGNIVMAPGTDGAATSFITKDAGRLGPKNPDPDLAVTYQNPSWSSDGALLAFIRESSTKAAGGRNYTWDLVVYDRTTGLTKNVIENQQVLGFAWKPGNRVIAYGVPIAFEFFTNNDVTNVRGLMQVDVNNGTISNLVLPERSLPLANPVWSSNGSIVAFEEVSQMEGRGAFAYYDFAYAKYISWEEAIGFYSLSPDNELVAYDTHVYTPSGTEQIYVKPLAGGDSTQLTNVIAPDYAYWPVFSPDGSQIVYFTSKGGVDAQEYEVNVIPSSGGEPRSLGFVTNPLNPVWSPDGTHLYLSRGPFENQEVIDIEVSTGMVTMISRGSQPAVTEG